MSQPAKADFWTLDPAASWPPGGIVRPPLSPTNFARQRTCWLQATFRATPGYPARSVPHAALGTAFHETLEHLPALAASDANLTARGLRERAVSYFQNAVARARDRADRRPRERHLPWPEPLIQKMAIQVAIAAGATPRRHAAPSVDLTSTVPALGNGLVGHGDAVYEETLTSRDGLLSGRPDRVELGPEGPIIIDYKTGRLDDPDHLAAYKQQCLLYAWLWYETHGTWPVEYHLVHLATGAGHRGAIDPAECSLLGKEAQQRAIQLAAPPSPDEQAHTGDHCALCSYRPWCEPFWRAASPSFIHDDGEHTPRLTFAATMIAPSDRRGGSIILSVRMRDGRAVTVEAPATIFDHLGQLPAGTHLRYIDAELRDDESGWYTLSPWSEVFIVMANEKLG